MPQLQVLGETGGRLNLTLYMESFCPFCKKFVKGQLKDLFDQAPELLDKIDLHIEPGVFANQAKDGNWTCLHGDKECHLDRFELCVLHTYPELKAWWPFIECVEATKEKLLKDKDAKALKGCASAHGVDYAKMDSCATGTEGEDLLKAQQPKEDAFLAEPNTKVFVREQAKEAFTDAVAQAYGSLGGDDKALEEVKKLFNDEIDKLVQAAKNKTAAAKAGKAAGKAAPPPRSFLPYVPLLTIMDGANQTIINMNVEGVTLLGEVCKRITDAQKPAACANATETATVAPSAPAGSKSEAKSGDKTVAGNKQVAAKVVQHKGS